MLKLRELIRVKPAKLMGGGAGFAVAGLLAALLLLGATSHATAAPYFQAAGTAVESTTTASPAWPAHAIDDIALLFVESTGGQAATLSTPAGFAAVLNSPQFTGTGLAGTRLTVFWARATSASMPSPTVLDPGNHVYAQILTYRGVISTGDPWDVTGGGVKASASTSVTVTGVTTTVANTLIVQAVARDNDLAAAAFSLQTNANLTSITERSDAGTALNNGGGFAVWDGVKATAGATWDTTATVTSSINAFLTIALKPPPVLNDFLVEAAVGGSIGTQTAGTAFNIKITARDQYNNTMTGFTGAGNTVDITSTGTLSAGGGTTPTFTNGVLASTSVTISNTGSFTITATKTAGTETGTSNAFTVNPGALANFLVEAAGGGANWYNAAWLYRKKIIIDNTKVGSGGVTNFPVYVNLADLGADFFANVLSAGGTDGGDIRVTRSDGVTELPRQVVAINVGAQTGELHFKADSLSSSVPTEFYIYYRNAAASEPAPASTYGSQNVWTNGYAGVWHLKETTGGAGAIKDSTANANHGTDTGGPALGSAGQVGNAISFDGLDDIIDLGTNGSLDVSYLTIDFWVKVTSWIDNGGILAKGTDANRQYWIWTYGGTAAFTVDQGATHNAAWSPASGQWTHLALTYDGANVITYRNGVVENTYPQATGLIDAVASSLKFGNIPGYAYANVVLDEVRISNGARSTAWITTEYNNQNSASTFYGVAAAETAGGGAIGTQTAGTPFNIKITARDANNNTVTGFTGTVTITSTGTLSAGGGTTAAFTAGVLASHSVTISNTGSFTITATAGSAGTSNAFTVNPGALANFLVEAQGGGAIGTQTAGIPFSIKITARDANNNTVTGFTGTVTITSTGTLSAGGGATAAFTAGVLASHSVTISNTGSFTITATAGSAGTSNAFTVNAAVTASITGTTPASLTESNLNGATVAVMIANGTYDASLFTTDFTLNGAPAGTTISGVVRDSATQATLTLAFNGTDFDVNASMSVTVLQAGLATGTNPATTGTVTITAVVEPADLQQIHYRWRNDDGGEGAGLNTGTGADGSVTIATTQNINTAVLGSLRSTNADGIVTTVSSFGSATGGTTLTVASATGFAAGDEVLLINLQGDSTNNGNAGKYEFLRIDSIAATTFTFTTSIQNIYGATTSNLTLTGQKVVVQRVPQWTTVTVNSGGTLTANAWAGTSGGVLVFRATGAVTINSGGSIDVTGKGYRGGNGPDTGSNVQGWSGESYGGASVQSSSNNGGGGGGGNLTNVGVDACGEGGAGAGYGTAGTVGGYGTSCGGARPAASVGTTYGVANLTKTYLGSGGGGGGNDEHSTGASGDGGNGGGLIIIYANSVAVAGALQANGNNGQEAPSSGDNGDGAGGSGGSIYIAANTATLGSGLTRAIGGTGGSGSDNPTWNGPGGNGGQGRIRIEANTITGTTNPAASTAGAPGASWAADEDTLLNLAKSTLKRLRFGVANKGTGPASGTTYLLEVSGPNPASCSAAAFSAVPTAAGGHWQIVDSANLTDGAATTDVTPGLTNENSTFVAGQVKDTGNQTTGISLATTEFTEIEFALQATTNATDGALYCFRLTNAGATTNFTYFQYGQARLLGLDHFLVEAFGGGSIGTQTAGTPFSIRITAQDINNSTWTAFTSSVNITSTGTLSAGGGATAAFTAGVLVSHSVTISNTGTFTLTATAGSTGTSNAFTVNPGTAITPPSLRRRGPRPRPSPSTCRPARSRTT